jgi:hypothetical protein
MKKTVSLPLLIGAIVLVVGLVVFIGYHSFSDSGVTNLPTIGPIKETENMAPGPRPAGTMGARGPKVQVAH